MVFGRVAFELLAQYWPTAASNPQVSAKHVEMARLMNELPKYVISTRLRGVEWSNSHIIGGNVADAIRQLKEQPGKDLALFAGAGAASTFMRLGAAALCIAIGHIAQQNARHAERMPVIVLMVNDFLDAKPNKQ
jgi:dihydrofolate reductase